MDEAAGGMKKEVGAEVLRLALAQAQSGWAAWDSLDRKLAAVFAQSITLAVAAAGAVGAALLGRVAIPGYLALGAAVLGGMFVLAGVIAMWGMRPRAATPYGARPVWSDTHALRASEAGDAMVLLAWGQSDVWEANERCMAPVRRAALASQLVLLAAVPSGAFAALVAARWPF
ncbi:hypothetical protein KTR66_19480 [Roseococcus sp. SDR]|uniref:hypothetical protein n=1 Tax=Roseococcus sp. SDR TaxID=2835532 RepID=UPI001BD012A8|nr:hypothetical protein [Roseococcus sp. SDR]MBS7792190.1 hypothetical protein [Roseococcus sp. SDR]MBV1847504.1 hypothetical protein [Roseococcus sp. SDR]